MILSSDLPADRQRPMLANDEHEREHRRTRCHQSICAQTGHALPPLAFRSNECAEVQRQSQPNCKMMPKHCSSFPPNGRKDDGHPRRSQTVRRFWAHETVDARAPLNLSLSGETQKPHSLGFVVIRVSEREKGGNRLVITLTHRGVLEISPTRRFRFLN